MQVLEQILPNGPSPEDAYLVQEGWAAVGHPGSGITHITTHGLWVCKGITIYDPNLQRGLVAHLAQTEDPEKSLNHVLEINDNDLYNSEVNVVRAVQFDPTLYPYLDTITAFFKKYSPRKLIIDPNIEAANRSTEEQRRSITLNLLTGAVSQVPPENGRLTKPASVERSEPIYGSIAYDIYSGISRR